MRKLTLLSLFINALFLVTLQGQPVSKKELKQLAATMAGEFSSEAQSKLDTTYYHIKLRMKPIWKDRTDGYWFYVEQSIASMQEKPYRQRVYHLYLNDDTTVVSKVFEMKNPSKYTRGWADPSKLAGLKPDSLVDRQGCAISLHKRGQKVFSGSTPGRECLSSLRGAAYATSEVTVYPGKLVSWDRGWDKEDKQVWGAKKGGYIFIKVKKFK